jgi:hypothetical protein
MNNGIGEGACDFHWVSNGTSPNLTNPVFIQYEWPTAVTIGSFYIETTNATATIACASAGRNIASGRVEWWNGMQWVVAGSFAGLVDDVQFNLPAPVQTTRLRVVDLTVTDVPGGNGNSVIYEWHVYAGSSCIPPP